MKIYTVHHRIEAAASLTGLSEDAIFVKEGFSWPAFFVPLIWLIYKRMWWVLAGFVAVEIALTTFIAASGLGDGSAIAVSFAINLIMGFEGNDLYRWSLARRRYKLAAIVTGAGQEDAEHRYFSDVIGGSRLAAPGAGV
jgi:hypothetical protein